MCTGIYLFFDFFFHFQKKYIPTPVKRQTPMNIYIGFIISPKRYAMRRLVAVLNYFSSLIIIMIVPPAPNIIQNIPPILLIVFFRLNICHPHNDMNKNKSIMPYLSTYFLSSFTYFDMISFLSSLNAMESLALSAKPSISSISPSPKSLCTTLSPMENFAIYLINPLY